MFGKLICISFVNFLIQILICLINKPNLVNCIKNDIGAIVSSDEAFSEVILMLFIF